jgi:hypothetical protein
MTHLSPKPRHDPDRVLAFGSALVDVTEFEISQSCNRLDAFAEWVSRGMSWLLG